MDTTLIFAIPFFRAVILPDEVTLATLVFSEVNLALPTLPVTFRVAVFLTFRVSFVALNLGFFTVNLNDLEIPLFVTVIVAVPLFTAVTLPLEETFAIFELELLYFVAPLGLFTVALICEVAFTYSDLG